MSVNTKDGREQFYSNGLSPELQKQLLSMVNWIERAACRDNPDPGFVAERTNNAAKNREIETRPKQICAGCPVKFECLDHALKMPERGGIWGGMNDMERDVMAERYSRLYPEAGYKVLNR